MRTPVERAIHRRAAIRLPHANEFLGRRFAQREASVATCNAMTRAQRSPRPAVFDPLAHRCPTTRGFQVGVFRRQTCIRGHGPRQADAVLFEVANPSRQWATGDCTRCKKPARSGLRQSSVAPRLPASLHRNAPRLLFEFFASRCLASCNEERLLSRRIIIRLVGDVKKKVPKNHAIECARIAMTNTSMR